MLALIFAASLLFTEADASFAYQTASNLVANCTPRDAGTIRGRIAAYHILDVASETGADVRQDVFKRQTPKGEREFVNLYAKFQSNKTNRWVVLVSHYDTKPGVICPGANDGASTTGLLVSMANVLTNARKLDGNVLLVWADSEECIESYDEMDGLQGARRAVEWVKDRQMPIQAVLCLDMLGDRDLHITIPQNGSSALAKIAVHAARRIGVTDLVSLVKETVTDDHVPFHEAGYPAIDLIDFSYGENNCHWHAESDTMENVSVDSLLKSGKLVTEMLNILL